MRFPLLLIASSVLALSAAQASTVGFWRFEAGAFLDDSSANAITLSNDNGMAQVALGSSGFLNPIPLTGDVNGSMADFTANSGVSGFSAADNAVLGSIAANGTLTIEAFINSGTIPNSGSEDARYIAGQWSSSANDRSWALQVNTSEALRLFIGDGATSYGSTFSPDGIIDANTDYYVAVTFDVATDSSTFYWLDLNDPSAVLESHTTGLVSTSSSAFGNPVDAIALGDASADFTIGWRVGSSKRWNRDGFIDEVRLSNTVLSESELMVVPEPSTIALMLLGGVAVFALVRRRK